MECEYIESEGIKLKIKRKKEIEELPKEVNNKDQLNGKSGEKVSKEFPNFAALTKEERLAFFEALTIARQNVEKKGNHTRKTFGTIHDEYLKYFEKIHQDQEGEIQDLGSGFAGQETRTTNIPSHGEEESSSGKFARPTGGRTGKFSVRTVTSVADDSTSQKTSSKGRSLEGPCEIATGTGHLSCAETSGRSANESKNYFSNLKESLTNTKSNAKYECNINEKERDFSLRIPQSENVEWPEAKTKGFRVSEETWEKLPRRPNKENIQPAGTDRNETEVLYGSLDEKSTPQFDALDADEREIFFNILKEARQNVVEKNGPKKMEFLNLDRILNRYKNQSEMTSCFPASIGENLHRKSCIRREEKNLRVRLTLTSADNHRIKAERNTEKTKCQESLEVPRPNVGSVSPKQVDLIREDPKTVDSNECQNPDKNEEIQESAPLKNESVASTEDVKSVGKVIAAAPEEGGAKLRATEESVDKCSREERESSVAKNEENKKFDAVEEDHEEKLANELTNEGTGDERDITKHREMKIKLTKKKNQKLNLSASSNSLKKANSIENEKVIEGKKEKLEKDSKAETKKEKRQIKSEIPKKNVPLEAVTHDPNTSPRGDGAIDQKHFDSSQTEKKENSQRNRSESLSDNFEKDKVAPEQEGADTLVTEQNRTRAATQEISVENHPNECPSLLTRRSKESQNETPIELEGDRTSGSVNVLGESKNQEKSGEHLGDTHKQVCQEGETEAKTVSATGESSSRLCENENDNTDRVDGLPSVANVDQDGGQTDGRNDKEEYSSESRPSEQVCRKEPDITRGKVVLMDDSVIERLDHLIQDLEKGAIRQDPIQKEYIQLLLAYLDYLSRIMHYLITAKIERDSRGITQVRSSLVSPAVCLEFKDFAKTGTGGKDDANPFLPRSVSSAGIRRDEKSKTTEGKERNGEELGDTIQRSLEESPSSLMMAPSSSESSSTIGSENETLSAPIFIKKKSIPVTKIRVLQDLLKERAAFVEGSISEYKIVEVPTGESAPTEEPTTRLHVEEEEETSSEKTVKFKFFKAFIKFCRCGKKEAANEDDILENLKGEAVAIDVSEGKTKNPASVTLNESTMEILKAAERKKMIQKYWKTG